MTATLLAAAALVFALLALALGLLAYRRADDTNTRMRGHLRDHEGPVRSHREGTRPERRAVKLGPPRATGERRHAAVYDDDLPPTEEHGLPPATEHDLPAAGEPTTELPLPGRLPRPGRIAQ